MGIPPKTVLILGAGSNVHYGFPTGPDLLTAVSRMLGTAKQNQEESRALQECGIDFEKQREFASVLKNSIQNNIDEFLSSNKAYRNIGAHAIAYLLLQMEARSLVESTDPRDADMVALFPARNGWYAHLFDDLDFNESGLNTEAPVLGVVSFNYDRSLEYFLCECIRISCKDFQEEGLAKLANIPIIHVHGDFGSLDEMAYGPERISAPILKQAAEKLKFVFDEFENSARFRDAQMLIEKADNILFLGFGYDRVNLHRLDLLGHEGKPYRGDGKKIVGTLFFPEEADQRQKQQERLKEVKSLFKGAITLVGKSAEELFAEDVGAHFKKKRREKIVGRRETSGSTRDRLSKSIQEARQRRR